MNYKLEKFWNVSAYCFINAFTFKWTINLKSFEIWYIEFEKCLYNLWTINLKSFEIGIERLKRKKKEAWTINLKSFEIRKRNSKSIFI